MGQSSSSQNQTIQKKAISNLPKQSQNRYNERRQQSLRTEEDEKSFYEDYSIVQRINDNYLGDCVIMREKYSKMKVCVKEQVVQSREQMRQIQQNLLKNYNCYNNDEEDGNQQSNRTEKQQQPACSTTADNLTTRRDNSNKQNDIFNNYHLNLISVVRVVKAKDELDFFLCSQQFRVIYALEYSDYNLSNYFTNQHQPFSEVDIWQLLEQLSSALLFLQNQGKFHGNLRSSSIYIMPSPSCPHQQQFSSNQTIPSNEKMSSNNTTSLNQAMQCDCNSKPNQFKWYKIAENSLVRSLSLHERVSQYFFYLNKKKKRGIVGIADDPERQFLKGCYLAPELIEDINNVNCKSSHDVHKSDIFSLGCVILEIMGKSLEKYNITVNMDGVFEIGQLNSETIFKFSQEKLQSRIDLIASYKLYSETLINIVKSMVIIDQFKRPDFKELVIVLQRMGKFNTPQNTQMINKQSEILSSFNMTKSVQFNSLNSTKKINPLTALGNAESSEKMEKVQSFLDCLQQLQQEETQIQVEQSNDKYQLFQQSSLSSKPLQQLYHKENIIITPISQINYTQEIMQAEPPDENNYASCIYSQQDFKNKIRITSTTKKPQNFNQSPISIMQDYQNLNQIKERSDECDSTLPSNINKEYSSLNSSNVSGLKISSRNILQENKNILNVEDKVGDRYPQNSQNNSFAKHCKPDTFNNDVYAMIDANYKSNVNSYQHRKSNSTTLSIQSYESHQKPILADSQSIKSNSFMNQYNSSSINSNKLNLNKSDQNQCAYQFQRSASNSQIPYSYEGEQSSVMSKDIEKTLNNSYNSQNIQSYNSLQQQQQNLPSQQNFIPKIKQQLKNSYLGSQNLDEIEKCKNIDNIVQKSNKIIMNQRQELMQFMKNNLLPTNFINQTEQKYDSTTPLNIANPSEETWKLQDSISSNKSYLPMNHENERIKSVQIENYDLSFIEGSESQFSSRSNQTYRFPMSSQLKTQILKQNQQQQLSVNKSNNQLSQEYQSHSVKYDPKSVMYDNSVRIATPAIQKQQRSMSLKDEIELNLQDQSFKINNPNVQQTPNMIVNSNQNSINNTPRTFQNNSYTQKENSITQQLQYKYVPLPLNIDSMKSQTKGELSYDQFGQNTESILDCSLVNDERTGNTSMNYNQQQLFTYSTGTLPSSTRNRCKRRTQSSFMNDSSLHHPNNNTNNYNTEMLLLNQHSNIAAKIQQDQAIQQEQTEQPVHNSMQQKQQVFQQQQPLSLRHQKMKLETVQELKESYFNQTINLSNKKYINQSTFNEQQIESTNSLAASNTPNQSTRREKIYTPRIQENNVQLQHSPPLSKQIQVKEFISNQEESKTIAVNRQKEYVYEQYEDGAYYQGENWGSLRWGLGKFVYADGACFEGEWERGQMNGFGKLYYPSGNLAYEGKWKDDKFNGRGVIFNEKPIKLLPGTEINYENLNNMTEEWIKFDGEFKMDEKVGFGTFYFSNGSKFQCTFVDDMAEGVGTFSFSDSISQLIGEWKQNVLIHAFRQK